MVEDKKIDDRIRCNICWQRKPKEDIVQVNAFLYCTRCIEMRRKRREEQKKHGI